MLSTKSHLKILIGHRNDSRSEGNKRLMEMSKQFDYSKHPRMVWIVEEHVNLQEKLGVAIRFDSSSLINHSDEMLG